MTVRKFELKAFQDLAFPVRVGMSMTDGKMVGGGASPHVKKVTVIINGSDICMDSINKALKELKYKGCYITAVFSKAAEAIVDMDSFKKDVAPDRIVLEPYREGIKNLILNTDLCIAPNITQNTLTKTALGIQDELSSLLLWQFLINGVSTVISTDSVYHGWFDADLNSAMKRVLEGYVKTLVSFGAKVEENFDYSKYIQFESAVKSDSPIIAAPRPQGVKVNATNANANSDVKVITESFVRSCKVSQISLQKGQMITPLAMDTARSLGIAIVRN